MGIDSKLFFEWLNIICTLVTWGFIRTQLVLFQISIHMWHYPLVLLSRSHLMVLSNGLYWSLIQSRCDIVTMALLFQSNAPTLKITQFGCGLMVKEADFVQKFYTFLCVGLLNASAICFVHYFLPSHPAIQRPVCSTLRNFKGITTIMFHTTKDVVPFVPNLIFMGDWFSPSCLCLFYYGLA